MNKTGGYETSVYPKSRSLSMVMLMCKFLCNVYATRALIGISLLLMSHMDQICDHRDSRAFTIAHKVIGLSLYIHYSFI